MPEAWTLLQEFVPVRSPACLGLVAAVLVSFAGRAAATHAVDHRYLVLGYVHDAAGKPIRQAVVRVVREKTGLVHDARTDAHGFYLVIVHLHDDDVLDPLLVNVGRAAIRIEARFNPLPIQPAECPEPPRDESGLRRRRRAGTAGHLCRHPRAIPEGVM